MSPKSSILKKILYMVIALAIILFVIFKLKRNKEISESKVYQYNKEEGIHVQSDTLRFENINDENYFSGTFNPERESKLSAEVQGKINELLVDEGSIVRKGQPLIQLDNSLLKLQLQSIEVQIEGLKADVHRFTILAQADAIQGVQLEKALLGLKSAEIQKVTIQEQISKTTIKAPFSGVITAKLTDEGGFAAPGIPLLQITDISKLRFTVNVPEKDLDKFVLNSEHTISADVFPEISLTGKTILIGSKANMGNSFPVQFSVPNTSDLKIKSGMFGKVHLKNENQNRTIIIPASAIIGSENHAQVYLIKNGKSVLHNIKVSGKVENKAIVTEGLNDGDVIVVNGFINLFDGANVIVQ